MGHQGEDRHQGHLRLVIGRDGHGRDGAIDAREHADDERQGAMAGRLTAFIMGWTMKSISRSQPLQAKREVRKDTGTMI